MAVGTTNYPTSLDTVVELIEAANNASTTLDGAIDDAVTTITVASTSSFAASGVIAIDNELISYTAKTATDFTGCTRGFEGTAAASHLTGVAVEQIITARSHNVLASALIAIETKLGTGTSIALNKLATVTASRALVSDASGYASASGVTATELGYLSGVTSAIQAQLGNKAATGAVGSSGLTMATDRLLGRTTASSGAIEEITVGSGLSLSGGTLTATGGGGSGTVTSVGLSLPAIFNVSNSPVTTSGTLTGALADQNANVIFAGPSTGAATAPTFRSLVAADIPGVLSITKLSNLTSNGFVKTGSGDGTLSVDTSTYLTANQSISLSGDVSGSGTTAITTTIGANKVTLGMLAQVATATFLGRTTASTGDVESLSAAQATALLSAFVGDSGSGGTKGLVPAPTTGDATKFLKGDGTWATAGGSSGLTIGTTAITSGAAGRILYETAANVVGETAGFSYQPAASPNVTITAQNASYTALRVNSAASPSANIAEFTVNGNIGAYVNTQGYFSGQIPGVTSTRQVVMGNWATGPIAVGTDAILIGGSSSMAYGPTTGSTGTNITAIGHAVSIGRFAAYTGSNVIMIGSATGSGNYRNSVLIGLNASGSGGNIRHFAMVGVDDSGGSLTVGDNTLAMGNVSSGSNYTLASNVGYFGVSVAAPAGVPTSAGELVFAHGQATNGFDQIFFGKGRTATSPTAITINGTGGSGSNIAGANVDLAGGRGTGSGNPGTIGLEFARPGSSGSSLNALSDEWRASYATTDTVRLTANIKTSTTNLTEAAAMSALWTDATHATRTAKLQFQLVGNAAALATVAEFDMDGTAGNTRFLIYDVDNATLERVSVGAADSGGTGYKVLRIPN